MKQSRLSTGKLGVVGYILNQAGIFPTSVLVNIRKDEGRLEFIPQMKLFEKVEIGTLKIPDDVKWYIIDGQHRIEALKKVLQEKEDIHKYPLIVSMMNENKFNEMLFFWLVNSRAKSVETGLAYRILQNMLYNIKAPEWVESIMKGADRRIGIAATIVDYLNGREDSPFYRRIKEEGEPTKSHHLTTDQTMTRYISIVLKEPIFEGMYDEDVADLLIRYWNAIKRIYPACFDKHEEYALMSTIGLSVMHRLFPTIYGYCSLDGNMSSENMEKYLRYLLQETPRHKYPDFRRPIDERWWHKTDSPALGVIMGTGEGHYKSVALNFTEKIKEAIRIEREK